MKMYDLAKSLILISFFCFLVACHSTDEMDADVAVNGFDTLISYMESEADFVNAPDTPFLISAPEIYSNLQNNYLVIDIRSSEEYEKARIKGSVHVLPKDVIPFLENDIHAPGFEKIALVCNGGHESAYVAMAARYLGYSNVYPIRNGLSSWDYSIAREHRLKNISDSQIDNLVTTEFQMNPAGEFPVIKTTRSDGYEILRDRIIEILSDDITDRFITIDDVMDDRESYYLISYWPESRYNRGHLPGAIRYQPKNALRSDKSLNTLPLDMPIVIQCFMGTHSNFVTLYLNILGYDAKSMVYGANSFMYSIMKEEESPGRHFAEEKDIFHYPMISDEGAITPGEVIEPVQKVIPDGGC